MSKLASNGAGEMDFGLLDRKEHSVHNGVGFVEISETFVTQDVGVFWTIQRSVSHFRELS